MQMSTEMKEQAVTPSPQSLSELDAIDMQFKSEALDQEMKGFENELTEQRAKTKRDIQMLDSMETSME
jgi:hypothetical protein